VKKRPTRAEKTEQTRQNLLAAAVKVVGRKGYRDASIDEITDEANVAHGTFYNYFHSRQDLLDQLLPELGLMLLNYLGSQVGDTTFLAREEKSIRAYFEFLRDNPEFYRILIEAQVYAPGSFARHADNLIDNYVTALRKTKERGYLDDFDETEFEAIAAMLLGARVYLGRPFARDLGKIDDIPEQALRTFLKLVSGGLGGSAMTRPVTAASGSGGLTSAFACASVRNESNALVADYALTSATLDQPGCKIDMVMQQIAGDMLLRAAEALVGGGLRIRSCNTLLALSPMTEKVRGIGRLEYFENGEGTISCQLIDRSHKDMRLLMSAQASVFRE
jgi:AcrR family transcriptional regulator